MFKMYIITVSMLAQDQEVRLQRAKYANDAYFIEPKRMEGNADLVI